MGGETLRSTTRVTGFEDPELDFQLLRHLGSAVYGGAAVGECLAVAAQIRDGQGWTDAFAALAERQRAEAEQYAAAGHRVSARERYLHAANSFRAAEYFSPFGAQRHVDLGLASRAAFGSAMEYDPVHIEELWLPWNGQRLPGYWLSASPDPAPTLVATSGFDGTLEETYFQIGVSALQRGWNVMMICGPGQMDTARTEPDTHFVPDTESWVSPWIDMALARPGVDAGRLALLGISFGGYFVSRAAAHESRIAALVANSPVIDLRAYMVSFVAAMGGDPEQVLRPEDDFSLTDIDEIPDEEMPPTIKEMSRSLIRRFGQTTFLGTFAHLRQFSVDPAEIRCPALGLVGTGEGGEPIRQYEEFCQRAGGRVTGRMFTSAEGADTHCQLGNLTLSNAVTLDWLDEIVGSRP
ncbi:prolyl oligopeptidase family serine peptidase [Mycobacterium sp. CVI_P3]|uniref:Prolyl oligopeptidase family serine peptidase n=1 Tax=Mycobacterium pinniadriaticum TaxID=2994102 RepID=A0ABT3SF78_9MYCO|nr:prolyl oligopeptidase family serine peptidase [Mycobacterium pinniadriaticum]MCX2931239.1 prolyl oligopeptidase family serine peptidase [Mycobacterium pinniadriaticum]MCX2937537.1 prolyl oligopeptidase family serine peptidase [Mycobacterium pinniadriaticum]